MRRWTDPGSMTSGKRPVPPSCLEPTNTRRVDQCDLHTARCYRIEKEAVRSPLRQRAFVKEARDFQDESQCGAASTQLARLAPYSIGLPRSGDQALGDFAGFHLLPPLGMANWASNPECVELASRKYPP